MGNEFILNKFNKIKHYFRYVDDDSLVIINGNENDASDILNYLNKVQVNLTFILEIDTECQMNYLEITIFRKNNSFEFNIPCVLSSLHRRNFFIINFTRKSYSS